MLAIVGCLAACGGTASVSSPDAGSSARTSPADGASSLAGGASGAAGGASGAAGGASSPAPHVVGPATSGDPVATTALGSGTDAPLGFWYGTDSWPVPVSSRTPYQTPAVGGNYGGYIGMAGNWARWQGCGTGNFLAWSSANARQANTNYTRYGGGIGTAVYWYMGGPGVDPRWNGTAAEAATWGAEQAAHAIADAASEHVTYPVLFMDIEMPGIQPAPDNGWQDVYTSPCSGQTRPGQHVTPGLARAEFNGFGDYLTAHSRYKAGVYSDPAIWHQIFGTGKASLIPHTYEWTYEPETADLKAAPHGWCLAGAGRACAQFYGGVSGSSPYAVMWQWSGGGGVRNPIGDFDQIDTATVR